MSKLVKVCLLASLLALFVSQAVLAQTDDAAPSPELIAEAADEADVTEEVIIDEMVSPEDLGVNEPTLLPDSKFYFLKSWRRGIRSIFTRDPIKKAELKLRYASEKLLEARKLADKNKRPEILTKAAESFQREMGKVRVQIDKIKDTASTSPKVGKFLDKFVQKEFLHQKILDKIEEKVPEGALEKIKAVKEAQLVRFGEVMEKLEDKTQIKTRIENSLKQLKGSAFKQIKEMEILKRFEEKAPEAIKEKLMEAREGRLEDFKIKLIEMKPGVQEKFQNYLGKMKGLAEKKMEILEDVKEKVKEASPAMKERFESAREKILERASEETEKPGLRCKTSAIAPRTCKGRVVIERNEKGCPVPRCVEVAEPAIPSAQGGYYRMCTDLFDPVCGVNGRTYGNTCQIKMAEVEIEHKGACLGTNIEEPLPATPEVDVLEKGNMGKPEPKPKQTGPIPTSEPIPSPAPEPDTPTSTTNQPNKAGQ